jgi:hypothetical protein
MLTLRASAVTVPPPFSRPSRTPRKRNRDRGDRARWPLRYALSPKCARPSGARRGRPPQPRQGLRGRPPRFPGHEVADGGTQLAVHARPSPPAPQEPETGWSEPLAGCPDPSRTPVRDHSGPFGATSHDGTPADGGTTGPGPAKSGAPTRSARPTTAREPPRRRRGHLPVPRSAVPLGALPGEALADEARPSPAPSSGTPGATGPRRGGVGLAGANSPLRPYAYRTWLSWGSFLARAGSMSQASTGTDRPFPLRLRLGDTAALPDRHTRRPPAGSAPAAWAIASAAACRWGTA